MVDACIPKFAIYSLPFLTARKTLYCEEETSDTTSVMSRFLHACDVAISDFEISRDFRYRISDFSFFISSSSSVMRYRFSKIENLIFENLLIEGRWSIIIAISTVQLRSLTYEILKFFKLLKLSIYYLETLRQVCFKNVNLQIQNSNPKSGYRKMLNSRSDFLKLCIF